MLRRIAQRLAQSAHRMIQTVLEIAEGTPGPEGLVQLLARYNWAATSHGQTPAARRTLSTWLRR